MPLVNMKDMLEHAYRHNYAVGAFEVVNLEFLQGVLAAAERCRGPVILSLPESGSRADHEVLLPALEAAAQRASVPVAIHLEHARDIATVVHAINHGCNGVKADLGDQELGENISQTSAMAAAAHDCAVAVEGQLGFVPRPEGPGEISQTTVAEAKALVERTGVDCLSVIVGSAHSPADGKRKIDWNRLKQINEELGLPLVFHIGTSLSDNQIHRLISTGVAKITDHTLGDDIGARLKLRANAADGGYAAVMHGVGEAVCEVVEGRMRSWGAAGRAAEVLERCEHWLPLDQVINYHADGLDEQQLATAMDRGLEVLGALPGVRAVYSIKAEDHDGDLRCSWLVRFCHPKAWESVRQHPDYVAFADLRVRAANGGGKPPGDLGAERTQTLAGRARYPHWRGSEARGADRRSGSGWTRYPGA